MVCNWSVLLQKVSIFWLAKTRYKLAIIQIDLGVFSLPCLYLRKLIKSGWNLLWWFQLEQSYLTQYAFSYFYTICYDISNFGLYFLGSGLYMVSFFLAKVVCHHWKCKAIRSSPYAAHLLQAITYFFSSRTCYHEVYCKDSSRIKVFGL